MGVGMAAPRKCLGRVAGTLLMLVAAAGAAGADDGADRASWLRYLDNDYYKVNLDIRPRMELADVDGSDFAQAWTVRTQLGIGNKPVAGFSAYAEMEANFSLAPKEYWDGTGESNGKSIVADPQFVQLNQGFARYENTEWADLRLTGGRQRITLDDHRFIGNVIWRQNEQTFDAVRASSSLGVEDLTAQYAYLWKINRIFADQGFPSTQDWNSGSHLLHIGYKGFGAISVVAFAYLLEFSSSDANSSNSYGFRLKGRRAFGGGAWSVAWFGSYAYQTDAGDNPVGYGAHYVAADGNLGYDGIGAFGVGYELLGSDAGEARFVTPLATAHKFNGFADAFLDNGGPDGLQDLYFYMAPKLPAQFAGRVIYHRFWSDSGGKTLGHEFDFVLSRALNEYVSILTKGAFFAGDSAGPADRWRYWVEMTVKF